MRHLIYLLIYCLLFATTSVSLLAENLSQENKNPAPTILGWEIKQITMRGTRLSANVFWAHPKYELVRPEVLRNAINNMPNKTAEEVDYDYFAKSLLTRIVDSYSNRAIWSPQPAAGLVFSVDRETRSRYYAEVIVITSTGEVLVSNAEGGYFMPLIKYTENRVLLTIKFN